MANLSFRHFRTNALLLLCFIAKAAHAQGGLSTPGEILLGLQKLGTAGSVLYIAAHPDDENTRLLAWLANERKLRTGYLSLTRGDGGQNLIGKEQGEALGLIRTQELLAARRVDGAEQFFTRAYDFGFSKNPEETFGFWNRDSVLADVVWVIRQFRPDVIITRFPTTGEGGHGHHTASAMLAVEAFDAAADPRRFPEQLAFVKPWQTRRIFWNTFNFGGNNTTAPNQLQIDVGGFNPLLGKSYGEIAAESRTMHKSQGFGTAPQRGSSIEYFKLLKGDTAKLDVLEGVDLSWTRINGAAGIETDVAALVKAFSPAAPESSIPGLLKLRRKINDLIEQDHRGKLSWDRRSIPDWYKMKLDAINELILACAAIYLEGAAPYAAGTPVSATSIIVQALNRGKVPANLAYYVSAPGSYRSVGAALKRDKAFADTVQILPAPRYPYTDPYWLKLPRKGAMFHVPYLYRIGMAEFSELNVRFCVEIMSERIEVERPIIFKSTDPIKGEVVRPFEILPPVTISVGEKALVFEGVKPRIIHVSIQSQADSVNGRLELNAPQGWKVVIAHPDFALKGKGSEANIEATITPQSGAAQGMLSATAITSTGRYTTGIRRIQYDHIPAQFYLPEATSTLVPLDIKKAGTKIGYIAGAGDDVPAALSQIGYSITMLSDDMLAAGSLSGYDAIVTGVRAYNVNDKLPKYYDRLMEYVKAGGNLIVQYNTNTRLGPMTAKPGPYPFTIANVRVTDEAAAVSFTKPDHAALNYPNKITQQDFEGWIQERGIYFATDIDSHYETILSMNDKGEKPADGSLIIGKYGVGNFVYTGLVFFRQLPAGNPGAYRLFVNLLSLPRNK